MGDNVDKKDYASSPCPFLRSQCQAGIMDSQKEPIGKLAKDISKIMDNGIEKSPPKLELMAIALVGGAKNFGSVFKTLFKGFSVNDLRTGPLDKLGGGSRIINQDGTFNEDEFERMKGYAKDFHDENGDIELGLDSEALERFMDDNFSRPTKRRRKIDRFLMNGEWPKLLQAMGKTHGNVPYLSMIEIRELITQHRMPDRVQGRLEAK